MASKDEIRSQLTDSFIGYIMSRCISLFLRFQIQLSKEESSTLEDTLTSPRPHVRQRIDGTTPWKYNVLPNHPILMIHRGRNMYIVLGELQHGMYDGRRCYLEMQYQWARCVLYIDISFALNMIDLQEIPRFRYLPPGTSRRASNTHCSSQRCPLNVGPPPPPPPPPTHTHTHFLWVHLSIKMPITTQRTEALLN